LVDFTVCFFTHSERAVLEMKMAFILFDRMTTLDFIGFYDVITRLKTFNLMENVTWDLCAPNEWVTDELGVTMKVDHVLPDLSDYDLVFIPGGMGTRALRYDADFIAWVQTAQQVKYKVSVCTGSLLLGAAGFLAGKKATTHPAAYDLLTPYCTEVIQERIVKDGLVFTGGGVTTSIDLGLYLVEYFIGAEAVRTIQKTMDYPYYQTGIYLL
jgi:transcriptional regulator GlxA family with amidase domain